MINTKHVKDRRKLRFESLDEAVREAAALAEADRRGQLRATGNWSLGQALGHLAFWANAPFDGYPDLRRPPWLLRLVLPLFKPRFLNKGLPAGVRIPGPPAGTFGTDEMSTEDGLAAMRAGFQRMARQAPTKENPVFGPMTHEDWRKLNLRHAELHLGFFHPS
jgi:hypothetical protein